MASKNLQAKMAADQAKKNEQALKQAGQQITEATKELATEFGAAVKTVEKVEAKALTQAEKDATPRRTPSPG